MKQLVLLSKEEYEGLTHYGVPGMKWGVRKEPETKGGSKGGGSSTKGSEKRRSMKDRVTAAAPYVKRLLVGGLLAYAGYTLGKEAGLSKGREEVQSKWDAAKSQRRENMYYANKVREGYRKSRMTIGENEGDVMGAIRDIDTWEEYASGGGWLKDWRMTD